MADGCYGILFSTMLRRKSPLGRFQRQGESYYARPFGRAFSSVPQDVARQKWLFGVGEFRNAAAKRSSITIRGSDSQRASLARATKIPGISAPWRRYCISDGFFPSLPSPLTRASSPPFVLSLALRSTFLFPTYNPDICKGTLSIEFSWHIRATEVTQSRLRSRGSLLLSALYLFSSRVVDSMDAFAIPSWWMYANDYLIAQSQAGLLLSLM